MLIRMADKKHLSAETIADLTGLPIKAIRYNLGQVLQDWTEDKLDNPWKDEETD